MDRKLLTTIIEKFEGGPVGVGTLSAAIHEEKDTIEEIIEHRSDGPRIAQVLDRQATLAHEEPLVAKQALFSRRSRRTQTAT